jgi:hypothetical protein
MAKLEQLPGRLDLRLVAGRPFVFTVTCTGATITAPTLTMISGRSDVVTAGAPSVAVDANVITVAWTAQDTADLAALKTAGRTASFTYDLSATVDGEGPYSLLAHAFTVEPLGTATTGTQTTSASLAFEVGQADVSLAITLAGGGAVVGVLNDLTDVTITAAASGDILRHNGTAWVDTPGTSHFDAAGSSAAVAADLAAHVADTTAAHAASAVSFTPTGTISATTVQAAIVEVANEAGSIGPSNVGGLLYLYANFT